MIDEWIDKQNKFVFYNRKEGVRRNYFCYESFKMELDSLQNNQ